MVFFSTTGLKTSYSREIVLFNVYCLPVPEFKKHFPFEHEICLLINVKMPKIVGILTFMSRTNRILGLSEPAKS